MPPAVIARVTVLGKAKSSILTFTDRHGREIGDYPQEAPVVDGEDSVVAYDYEHDSEITGVGKVPATEPTGVEMVNPKMPPKVPTMTLILGSSKYPTMPLTSKKPRAVQPASQPRRYLKTLHLHT